MTEVTTFADLGLSDDLLRAVAEVGYTTPTPIQAQAIPHVLMGRDVLGCAQTGTGKTASFTLPMIDILAGGRARARMPRTLILEPTRELATQVAQSFELYGKHHKLNMALLIGGESFVDQQRKLERGVEVLIATPGRLMDLFERGKILLSDVKILVIDEADRMLDMGFIPDIEKIVSLLPRIRQTLFFSATMPPEIRRLAEKFLMNPKEVTVAPPASPALTVTQGLVMLHPEDKSRALLQLLADPDLRNSLTFCNRKRDVDILVKTLKRAGLDAHGLHGDMAQSKRTETLDKFRSGEVKLLVASDVAARGLDIHGLSHVFNYDVPIHAEDYVHRIGRTGRAGNLGHAYTLATPEDGLAVGAIIKLMGTEIPAVTLEGFEHPGFEAGDGRRSRRPGRKGAESSAPRGRSHKEAAPKTPAPTPAPAPVAAAPKEDYAAPIALVAAPVPAPKAAPSHSRAASSRKEPAFRRDRDRDDDTSVVGFGDHLPAFLMRRGRVAASGA